ncbi:MAG: hypothetical protein AAF917_07335 [Pseudomonadota bacterium]
MSRQVSASAPGKALVSGEYAVLHGAPAVVMAIDRRARVTVDDSRSDDHEVVAPGYSDTVGRFAIDVGRLTWRDGDVEAYHLFESVVEAASPELARPRRFSLDTRAFSAAASGQKLGFGSSASLASALAVALEAVSQNDVLALLAAASGHREFQAGQGSGADVAAALAGGLIEYRMGESGWTVLDWPVGLRYRYFFSGVSADTRQHIAKAAESGEPPTALIEASQLVAESFRIGNPRLIVETLRRYGVVLRDYSDALGLDVFGAGHDLLADAADDLGVVYKPCGAGGGDIGIVLAHEDDGIDMFSALARANGFEALDVELDPLGARVSE